MNQYLALLRLPSVPLLLTGVVLGRLTIGMTPLAIVLLASAATGSYAQAGAAAAAYAVALGGLAPLLGRLVDRVGQTAVLAWSAAGCAVALAALAFGAERGPPAFIAAAALAGALTPPLSACMRAVWSDLLRGTDRLESAFALESILQEVTYLAGPLLVAAAATAASPRVAVLLAAGCALAGTALFASARVSRAWRGGTRQGGGWAGPLRSGGVRVLLALVLCNATAFGTIEVTVAAFSDRAGAAATAGILLSVWSAGSLVGGLAYGSRRWRGDTRRRLVTLLALHAATVALLAVAGSVAGLGVALFVAGCAVAPWVACTYLLLDRAAPAGTLTEAFTWLTSAFGGGIALGNAVGGTLVQYAGTTAAFGFAAGAGVAALLVGLASLGGLWQRSPIASSPTSPPP